MREGHTERKEDIQLDLADINRPSRKVQVQPRHQPPRQQSHRQRPPHRPSQRIHKKRDNSLKGLLIIVICLAAIWLFLYVFFVEGNKKSEAMSHKEDELGEQISLELGEHPTWETNYLSISEYARPGTPIGIVKNIFVHYTANPGTSAAQNQSYFEQLKDTHITAASTHFIIGYEGEIINCIPLDEMGYAVQTRNEDSISIECCYLETDGEFTDETYHSLMELLCWLLDTYDLDEEDILRHYDCGGKKCPLYYTEHEDKWEQLKQDVKAVRDST